MDVPREILGRRHGRKKGTQDAALFSGHCAPHRKRAASLCALHLRRLAPIASFVPKSQTSKRPSAEPIPMRVPAGDTARVVTGVCIVLIVPTDFSRDEV